jgi:hypothetical protein
VISCSGGRADSEALFCADADADGIVSPVGACATVGSAHVAAIVRVVVGLVE